jgi:hypothetical protein
MKTLVDLVKAKNHVILEKLKDGIKEESGSAEKETQPTEEN